MTGTWRWSLVAIAGLGLAACAAPLLIYWSELPDPMAVHWSVDVRPDGAMPKTRWLLPLASIIGVALATALVGGARAYAAGRAARVAFVTLASAFAAGVSAKIVYLNLGRSVWTEAGRLTPGSLALPLVLAFALAAAAWLIGLRVWRDVRPPETAAAPPLSLAAGARAYWTGRAANVWLLVIGGALLAPAAVLLAARPQLGLPPPLFVAVVATLAVAAVVLELFSIVRVAIDRRGVRIRFGRLGLWTLRIPLARILAVQVVDVDPLAHSGWGYRGSLLLLRKASIVVRAGEALRLDLARGQRLFVTVDDAATGAQLLSALLAREPAPSGATEASPG